MQFNVVHLIYIVKCFPSNVIILIETKNYMNFIFFFFFLTIFANFRIFLKIIPLSGVFCEAMRWQPYFSYGIPVLKLCKFRYFSFLKSFFACEKNVVLFIFISIKEGLDATVLSSFLEKLILVFVFLLIYFSIQHLEYIQDEVRDTVKAQQVSHFCHPVWFFVS